MKVKTTSFTELSLPKKTSQSPSKVPLIAILPLRSSHGLPRHPTPPAPNNPKQGENVTQRAKEERDFAMDAVSSSGWAACRGNVPGALTSDLFLMLIFTHNFIKKILACENQIDKTRNKCLKKQFHASFQF